MTYSNEQEHFNRQIELQEIYDEGYKSALLGESENSNPFDGIEAEYWSDGFEDGKEDS